MKKFLKIFSVIAVLSCCMFSFVGCDIFKEDDAQNEYASLISERKIVREVINNTQLMLTNSIQQEPETLTSSSEISAKNGQSDAEQLLKWSTEDLQMYSTLIKAVTNSSDFVPGKLYNAKIEEEEDGELYGCYLLMNAYCDGDNMVTLNVWQAYSKDVKEFGDSVIVSFDIYYDEEYKPLRSIEYHHEYENEFGLVESFGIHEVVHSSNGDALTYRGAKTYTNGEKHIEIVDENGYLEYLEEDIVGEIGTQFDNAMLKIKERTYLFNFARPLAQADQDKIFSEF